MKNLITAYVKELKMISHDIGIIIFLIFLPFGYPIIYSLIYNPELVRDVDIVVVDHDCTKLSRELVRNMDATEQVNVTGYASNLAEARVAMNSHKAYGILEIPEGFEKKVGRNESSPAVFYSDMSLLLRFRGFMVASTNVAQAMGAELMSEDINRIAPLASTYMTGQPMGVASVSMGNLESGFDSFIMPGVLVLILQQCLVLALGMSGGTKRERPWLYGDPRPVKAGRTAAWMAGEGLAYFTVIIPAVIFMLYYVPLIFRFPQEGITFHIFLFILPMVIASIGLGFTMQGACRERETVFVLWVVTSIMFLFLSGLTWPRFAMPGFFKAVSDMVPATWGVEGFIRMNANGASLAQVGHDYTMLWILAAFYSLTGFLTQRFVVRPGLRNTSAPQLDTV